MVDHIFDTEEPTTQPTDGNSTRSVGMMFQVSVSDKVVSGGRFWVPSAGMPSGALWQLWDTTGPTKLAEFDLSTISSPTLDDWNEFSITPVALTASHDYTVCVFMDGSGHYPFTDAGSLPLTHGVCTASTGRYRLNFTSNDYPTQTYAGYFFADVIVDDATTDQNIAWDLAVETDTGFDMGSDLTVPWGLATETDTGFGIGSNLTVPWDMALEHDYSFTIGHTGGLVTLDKDMSTTWYLNVLADSIVDGACTLSAPDAAAVWVGSSPDDTLIASLNIEAGNTLPNFEALRGVLNHIAGTSGLSAHDALYYIAGGT